MIERRRYEPFHKTQNGQLLLVVLAWVTVIILLIHFHVL